MFYAQTQNKILYAITGKTAAEIIAARADADKPNMALSNWKGAKVRKQDIYTAKNYLSEDEIDSLNRFVVVFLETAELRAKDRQDIDTKFWQDNIDKIIHLNDKVLLNHKGSISNEQMKSQVISIYEQFNQNRLVIEAKQADEIDLKELKQLEENVKKRS
jgi:hypothetical protein